MKLSDFLHIPQKTIAENHDLVVLIDRYEFFYTTEVRECLIEVIQKTSPTFFIKLALSNSVIDKLCKSPELLPYWAKVWSSMQSDQTLAYEPLPTIHCFDLIKGTCVYGQYKVERQSNSEDAKDYLRKAAELDCFHAINIFCRAHLQRSPTNLTLAEIHDLMFFCQRASLFYWTPGYLLLTNVCIEIAASVKVAWSPQFNASSASEQYYRFAIEALYLAEYFHEFSEASIHNLYPGRSLSEVYKDTYLVDIPGAREKVLRLCPSLKSDDEAIRESAHAKFLQIADDYKLSLALQSTNMSACSS